MKKFWLLLLIIPFGCGLNAQTRDTLQLALKEEITLGASFDPVPFYYGGWDFNFWGGYNRFKIRLARSLKYPSEFLTDINFENLNYNTTGFYLQYFPFTNSYRLNNLWFEIGGEKSAGNIRAKLTGGEGNFDEYFLTASIGYLWFFSYRFYLNPFVTAHLRVYGDKTIIINGYYYDTQKLYPEISIRIGYHF